MNNKWLACVIAIAITGYLASPGFQDDELRYASLFPPIVDIKQEPTKAALQSLQRRTSPVKSACILTQTKDERYDASPLISSSDQKQRDIAFTSPDVLLAKSEIDASAKIALFEMASSCMNFRLQDNSLTFLRSSGCPDFDYSRIIKNHPIELLEQAAAQGSAKAQVMFAINAPVVAAMLRRQNTNETVQRAAQLIRSAEAYADAAGQTNNLEAIRVARNLYERGLLGTPNYEKAYLLALRIAKDGSKEDRDSLLRLEKRVSNGLRADGLSAGKSCRNQESENVYQSPFG